MPLLLTNLIWLQLSPPWIRRQMWLRETVNSSIIWCLSCLIKHIIDHPRTNDSHPITHEANGFGITTTWPGCGLTGLRYGVRVYPPFTAVTLLETAFPVACLRMWLSALPKTVGGKNAITARLSYCFRLTFLTEFMNIYESILHLNLETPTSMFGWWHFLCFLKVDSYGKIQVLPLLKNSHHNWETSKISGYFSLCKNIIP